MRRLARSPMFTGITLLTLAVGIGANTAIFSVLSGVLLKPLPYPEPERLVGVWETAPGINIADLNASPATYFTFREEGRAFERLGLWRHDSVSVTGMAEPEQVDALFVTEGTLPALGVPPVKGRWFSEKEDMPGTAGTVMLSYGYWQRRFGGDAGAIGKRLMVDGEAREVIGIMPQSFRFMNSRAALIFPFQLDRNKAFVGNFSYQCLARLKPGVTIARANADVARMLPMMLRKFKPAPGMSNKMFEDARVGPNVRPLKRDVVGNIGDVLWVLMGTVGIVLFIACANVANLLLVRAEGRQQELAIRAALGAGWTRIAREILLESVTLGVLGGLLGLALANWAIQLLAAIGPLNLPRLDEIAIDGKVMVFTAGIALAASLLAGLLPVIKHAGPSVETALRQGGRGSSGGRERHRARNVLVVVQVALALVLLISSGLMIRTVRALKDVQPGFTAPEQIFTLRLSIPETMIAKPEQVARMDEDIARRLASIPGVDHVGLSNSITMDGNTDNDPIFAEGRVYSESRMPPLRRFKFIGPGYFETMGNHLLAGRDVTWTDVYEKRNVVMVSENLARELWGGPAGALGKRVRENPKAPWREVVGVAGNERDNGAQEKAPAIVYWPMMIPDFWDMPVTVQRTMAFAIRSGRAGSAAFRKEVEQAVWSVNGNLPIADAWTVKEIFDRSMARTSFTLVMLAIAGSMALLLGLIGVYGVISYAVSRRTREIGIRMALGARKETVMRMFLRSGFMLTAIGVVCGVAVAAPLTRLMAVLLFGVSPLDPVTYGAVSLVLMGAALAASYVPARRATGVEPVEALRME
ncbi:MAG: ABC transporter permease [Bryobacterales bacterium]|nr:ABC transporter permease [Bryobacterales bacterium]